MRISRYSGAVSLVVALALILALAVVSSTGLAALVGDQAWVEHTHVVIENLGEVAAGMADVQRSARGFVITGDEAMLQTHRTAITRLRTAVEHTGLLTRDNPEQQEGVKVLRQEIGGALAYYERVVEARRQGAGVAIELVRHGEGGQRVGRVEAVVRRMKGIEQRLLAERNRRARSSARRSGWIVVIGNLAAVVTVVIVSLFNRREIRRRVTAQRAALDAAHALEEKIRDSDHRASQVRVLATLGEYLQAAASEADAAVVAATFLPQLLGPSTGQLLKIAPSRDSLERLAAWPAGAFAAEPGVAPADCWALRRGSVHESLSHGIRCDHLAGTEHAVCLPMHANGEVIGVVSAQFTDVELLDAHALDLGRNAADQIALAISSLTLRDALRSQAIRDALTGLFNRRYAEESLSREIGRASRRGGHVSVMLIDVDHFKSFNDAMGHGTGDRLLREIGSAIASLTRAEDVAARYGGDEFLVILSEAEVEQARARAAEIARRVRAIPIVHPESGKGPTLSIGIASAPEHGSSVETVVEAADAALYAAKQGGRDRIDCAAVTAGDAGAR